MNDADHKRSNIFFYAAAKSWPVKRFSNMYYKGAEIWHVKEIKSIFGY